MNIESKLAQAGFDRNERYGAVSTPIYQTATFRHEALGNSSGYDYSRTANPTRASLERAIAELEGGDKSFAFATGMAAVSAVLMLFEQGDEIIVSNDLYGGTYRIFETVFARYGIKAVYTETTDTELIRKALNPHTRAVFIETPTNPLMKISDIGAIAGIAKEHKLLCIVDNTFMTPCRQQPLALGADIIIHSGSKYLGGHNDTLSGFVVCANADLSEKIAFIQNAAGAVLGPGDSWLLLRGLKTLAIRMDRAESNAAALAAWLMERSEVRDVLYPGLGGHPVHASQASGGGAMLSFRVQDAALAERIINRVKLIAFAESLGGVETLITYPYTQTHADIPEEIRHRMGIGKDLLRLSVGIEHIDDLIEDLNQAIGA